MHLKRIVPPVGLPVSLAEVKAGANLDGGSDDDAKIAGLIRSAVEMIDGPDGEIQRCLLSQTWELRLDCFPGYFDYWRWPGWPYRPHYWHSKGLEIEIPLPPLQSVESITYLSGGDTIAEPERLRRCGHRRPLESAHSARDRMAERGLRDRGCGGDVRGWLRRRAE